MKTSTKNSRYSSKSRRLNSGDIEQNPKGSTNHSNVHERGQVNQIVNLAYKGNVGYMNKKTTDRERGAESKGKAMLNKI